MSNASSQAQALEAAIEAAEHYMKALKLASVPKDKQALDAKCKEWLSKAEKIKAAQDWLTATPADKNGSPRLQAPVSTRKLTTREEIILLEGAKLNGFIFPPWVSAPKPEEFQQDGGKLFLYVKPGTAGESEFLSSNSSLETNPIFIYQARRGIFLRDGNDLRNCCP